MRENQLSPSKTAPTKLTFDVRRTKNFEKNREFACKKIMQFYICNLKFILNKKYLQ